MTPLPCLWPSTIEPIYILPKLKAILAPPYLFMSSKEASLKERILYFVKYFEISLGSAVEMPINYFCRHKAYEDIAAMLSRERV